MPAYTITGVDGEDWTFAGWPGHGLKYVRGLAGAPYELDDVRAPQKVFFAGRSDQPNVVELGVHLRDPRGGDDAVATLAAWRSSLGRAVPRNDGGPLVRFTVEDSERFQEMRLLEIGDANFEQIRANHWVFDEFKLRSDESWWRTAPQDKTFVPAGFAAAKMKNFGDEPSWPWFRLDGPIINPTLGLYTEAISLPTLTTGQWLEIDTDPDWWQVKNHAGVDITWNVGARWRRQAEAYDAAIPVHITGSGTSGATKLRVVVPQLFHKAIG